MKRTLLIAAVACVCALAIAVSGIGPDMPELGGLAFANALILPASLRPSVKIPGPRGIVSVRAEASAEVKTLVENLNKTIAEFKAANDQRYDEIKKKVEDPVQAEKVDKINADVSTLKKQLDEALAKITAISVGGGGDPQAGKDVRANVRKFLSAKGGKRLALAQITPEHVDQYRAYQDAFATLLSHECNVEALPLEVKAQLTVGMDREAGFLVPTEQSMEMEKRIHETSPMRQIARVITIGLGAWEAPFKSSKGVSGGWVGEKSARPATGTGDIGLQRIDVHEQYAYPEVTQTMLDDAVLDIEAFVVEDTEDEMGRTENLAFVSGNGVRKPKGFLGYSSGAATTADASRAWGKLQYVASGASGAFPDASGIAGAKDPNAIIDLIAALNPAYRQGAVFTMNRGTEAAIRKLKDAEGRYFIDMGDTRTGVFAHNLFGYPIVNLEDMPAIDADTFSLAFGNFQRGYYIIDRAGFRVLRDPYTNKPYVGFYITKRTGGDVRNFDAIKLMKFAAS